MFIARTKIVQEMMANEEWNKKLENAITVKECQEVIVSYCKKKGYKVKEL